MAKDNSKEIYDRAVKAAKAAVEEYRKKYGEPVYCGFAWVVVPGNKPFGKWLMRNGLGSKHHPSGVSIWYSAWSNSQSMDLAEIGADAFANSLRKDAIVDVTTGSRPD